MATRDVEKIPRLQVFGVADFSNGDTWESDS